MFTISFLSHFRITRQDWVDGTEDATCRQALRYLLFNSLLPLSVGHGGDRDTVVHLFQGPLAGGGVGNPPDRPPFLWLYPVDVAVTGLGAGLFKLPTDHLSPDLSAWTSTSPDQRDRVQAGIAQALLPKVIKEVCIPLLDSLSTIPDPDVPNLFPPAKEA